MNPSSARRLAILLGMAASLLALVGCATPEQLEQRNAAKRAAWTAQTVDALIAQGDASSLMAAALLFRDPRQLSLVGPEPLTLAERAQERAPTDPAAAWLRYALCAGTVTCDAVSSGARLRMLDPDNGMGWWPDLQLSVTNRDVAASDQILDHLANAQSFRVYFNPTAVQVTDALGRVSGPAARALHLHGQSMALMTAMGGFAAQGIPPLQVLSNACRDATHAAARRATCMKIFSTLMNTADSTLLQSFGASLSLRLAPRGSTEFLAAERWHRTQDWRNAQFGILFNSWRIAAALKVQLTAMRQFAREEDSVLAVLRHYRRPFDPPADWVGPRHWH